jgi:rare lipoprotein A
MWGWVRMKLRVTNGVTFAALMLVSGAISVPSRADGLPQSPPPAEAPDIADPVRIAMVTKAITQVASAADIITPAPVETALGAPVPAPPPPKPPVPARAATQHPKNDRGARLAGDVPQLDHHRAADTGDGDWKITQVKAIGPCLVGTAAWYGGRYVGRQTSSGSRLDQIHATAAHRTLPLNSLVRVTNLSNGRSVVVRITDRGPVSKSLLIDMSPKAADELAMKTAGIVPVSIEQVVEVSDASK